MPRIWADTICSHRHEVREAILEATWELVTERGPLSVTMSGIAAKVGIGRATLYKYFPDTEAILLAYHERHVTDHLARLERIRRGRGSPGDRLEAVLHSYQFHFPSSTTRDGTSSEGEDQQGADGAEEHRSAPRAR